MGLAKIFTSAAQLYTKTNPTRPVTAQEVAFAAKMCRDFPDFEEDDGRACALRTRNIAEKFRRNDGGVGPEVAWEVHGQPMLDRMIEKFAETGKFI